jgi:hypothetical protein
LLYLALEGFGKYVLNLGPRLPEASQPMLMTHTLITLTCYQRLMTQMKEIGGNALLAQRTHMPNKA